jgi:hypothetical protein
VMLGEEKRLYIPPPPFRKTVCDSTVMLLLPPLAFPPLTVNPSNMVVAASNTESTTW